MSSFASSLSTPSFDVGAADPVVQREFADLRVRHADVSGLDRPLRAGLIPDDPACMALSRQASSAPHWSRVRNQALSTSMESWIPAPRALRQARATLRSQPASTKLAQIAFSVGVDALAHEKDGCGFASAFLRSRNSTVSVSSSRMALSAATGTNQERLCHVGDQAFYFDD